MPNTTNSSLKVISTVSRATALTYQFQSSCLVLSNILNHEFHLIASSISYTCNRILSSLFRSRKSSPDLAFLSSTSASEGMRFNCFTIINNNLNIFNVQFSLSVPFLSTITYFSTSATACYLQLPLRLEVNLNHLISLFTVVQCSFKFVCIWWSLISNCERNSFCSHFISFQVFDILNNN